MFYKRSLNGAPDPDDTWKKFPKIKEKTFKFNREKGETKEAKAEGGGVVASITMKNIVKMSFDLFIKKGDTQPIKDVDGIIAGTYSLIVVPELCPSQSYQVDCASPSIGESHDTDEGRFWHYEFKGLEPQKGTIVKDFDNTVEKRVTIPEGE